MSQQLSPAVSPENAVSLPLSRLATVLPGASRAFQRRGIDYCCGGDRTLGEACAGMGLDPSEVVLDMFSPQDGEAEQWDQRPLPELIEHILVSYHEPLRTELPDLVALAKKVERRHAEKKACPAGLTQHLTEMHRAVLEHLAKEEQVLFPLILNGQGARASGPVTAMEHEHREHADRLQRTRVLTNEFTPPESACTSWKALYLRLAQLEADLMDHVHLENNILFPRALYE